MRRAFAIGSFVVVLVTAATAMAGGKGVVASANGDYQFSGEAAGSTFDVGPRDVVPGPRQRRGRERGARHVLDSRGCGSSGRAAVLRRSFAGAVPVPRRGREPAGSKRLMPVRREPGTRIARFPSGAHELPVAPRCDAVVPPERACEVALVGEPGIERDACQWVVRRCDRDGRPPESSRACVACDAHAVRLPEGSRDVRRMSLHDLP